MAKVAIICDRELFSPFDQRVWKGALTLKKAGHFVEIITPHPNNELKEIDGIPIYCISKSRIPGITALKIMDKALKGEYDFFHCHEFNPLIYSLILVLHKDGEHQLREQYQRNH